MTTENDTVLVSLRALMLDLALESGSQYAAADATIKLQNLDMIAARFPEVRNVFVPPWMATGPNCSTTLL